MTVIFCYLHVFLEKLWAELADGSPRADGLPLARAIQPWLVSDTALHLRAYLREEPTPPIASSPLGTLGVAVSAILAWVGGPAMLYGFWYRSQPAHIWWLTTIIAALLVITFWTAISSGCSLRRHMHRPEIRGNSWPPAIHLTALVLLAIPAYWSSQLRTVTDLWAKPPPIAERHEETDEQIAIRTAREQTIESLEAREARLRDGEADWTEYVKNWFRPVPADLAEVNLTELPRDWLTRDEAMEEFYAEWCKRPTTGDCASEIPDDKDGDFQTEWTQRRATYLRTLTKPVLTRPNFDPRRSASVPTSPVWTSAGRICRARDLSQAQMERA